MASTAADERKEVAPDDIPKPGWKAVLKRTAKEFSNDNLTDWAAALTYYAVLALFPAMIVLVALLGLFGQYPQTTNELLDLTRQVGGPAGAGGSVCRPMHAMRSRVPSTTSCRARVAPARSSASACWPLSGRRPATS